MKLSCLRPLVALLISVALSACGGKASFSVNGTIRNLNNPGLVMANNGDTVSLPVGATSFTFPKSIDYGTEYNIVVQTQPQHMTCGVDLNSVTPPPSPASGSAGQFPSILVPFICVQNSYALGGTITGLTVAGLELGNGSNTTTVLPAAAATTFTFADKVPFGTFYSVGVVTQPPGLTCSVTNGTGTMGEAAVTNVGVACVPK
ncbi:hypothetical protein [Janthinobacterium agaricidamnosum]|uniref:Putative transmembrane domain protein n=1 Tax=Janthinobacterium agaricidamnosum NBRC 102515 = DSM 9628 TaxID=1349767 RepID=W0V1A5_9BURK|nr:hypothetical protein [Janthinobacterium agaricidamnosum]CDG81052.1 putative transmembrane domain protein [Janthinobacterium agaricidamnosum NBRC 102515 = DSM 9628]